MSYYVFYNEDQDGPAILYQRDLTERNVDLSHLGILIFPGENQNEEQIKIVLGDGDGDARKYDLLSNDLLFVTRSFFDHRFADARTFFEEVKRQARGLLTMEGEPAPLYYCDVSQEFHDQKVSTHPGSYPGECPCCRGHHPPYKLGSYETTEPTDGKVTVTFWDRNPYEYQEVEVPFHGPWTEIPDTVDLWFWQHDVRPEQLQEFLRNSFDVTQGELLN